MYLEKYKIEVPDSIIILEDSEDYLVNKNEHYVFQYIDEMTIRITHFNGKITIGRVLVYTQHDIYKIFFHKTKYKECSLENFNKLKAFL